MQRSISLPVKPSLSRYVDTPQLERSEEREELYHDDSGEHKFYLDTSASNFDRDSKISDCKTDDDYQCEDNFSEDMAEIESRNIEYLGNKTDLIKRRKTYYDEISKPYSYRVIGKFGQQKVVLSKLPQRSWRYCKDFVTTLVEQKWRYTFLMFVLSFFLCWIVFTIFWYLIGYAHGDLYFDPITGERLGEGKYPCVIGATTFTGFFIYTVETHTTIGFGEKYPSEECPESVFLFVVQLIIAVAIEGAMVGIVYAKMAKPPKQISKLKFSKSAVICQRDGKLCLMFRVCDPREQQTIGTKIKAYILEDKQTKEGETLQKCHKELKLIGNGSPFIMWPTIIVHVIDKTSPFYNCSPHELFNKRFELLVSIVGSSPSTGQVTESRTSYLPIEILWGHRFVNIINYDWSKSTYKIDYTHFHSTILVDTPICSAHQLYKIDKYRSKVSHTEKISTI